jgi:membrane fusion protein (multidrug efflux system)
MADRVDLATPSRLHALPRPSTRTLLLVIGPLAVAVAGLWFYFTGGRFISTDNAYAQADMVALSTEVSGMVKTIDVTDNEHVAAGQQLFTLDDRPFKYAFDMATAQLNQAEEDVAALKADWRSREQDIKLAQVDVDFARRDWARRKELFSQHVVPQSAMDQAQQALDAAQRKLAGAEQEAESVAAHLDHNPEIPIEQSARLSSTMRNGIWSIPSSARPRPGS